MSALTEARLVDATSAPSLSTLLEQLNALEDAAPNCSDVVDQTRIHTLVHELTSHLPPSTSPSVLSDLFADVGYDILHSLLPLVSPDSLQSSSAVKDVADSVLTCTVLYGSPREVYLPLLSHLSAHITPLAQQQEEEKLPQADERKQPPAVGHPSLPYVSFLLPYFVCLLHREKHAARQSSMFHSLSSLLAAFFAAVPTNESLAALLTPLQTVLQPENAAHVGLLLSLLASYLPPHYPQLVSQPSSDFALLLSLLPDTTASATFNLPALASYLRRRQLLTLQLSTMRQQSWELTEDEESLTRAHRESWHAVSTADDEADDDEEEEQDDEEERQRRGELRQTKAQLAALPPYPPAGIVCLVLVKLSGGDKREVEQLVRGEDGGVAGLRVQVDAMLGTDMAGQYRQLMIDILHHWLSLLPPQSLHYTPISSAAEVEEQTSDDSWMLAECITTLMMQPPTSHVVARPPDSNSSTAATLSPSTLLPLYLSRFTSASRFTLTASLIPACPFPPIQAILVSSLKDLLLTTTPSQQASAAVLDLLVSLLSQWSDVSTVLDRLDGLMAVLNVLRFAVLQFGAVQSLSDERRRQIVTAVRLMQQRVGLVEDSQSEQARKEVDLPLLLLKDLTTRLLELA